MGSFKIKDGIRLNYLIWDRETTFWDTQAILSSCKSGFVLASRCTSCGATAIKIDGIPLSDVHEHRLLIKLAVYLASGWADTGTLPAKLITSITLPGSTDSGSSGIG
jgi:hypothetical protein